MKKLEDSGRLTTLAKAQRQLDALIARDARPRSIRRAESRVARRAMVALTRQEVTPWQ